MVIDTHIHADGMSETELENMVSSGIKRAITCAYFPIVPKYPQTLIDLFRRLIDFDAFRAKKIGLALYVAIGIHPRSIPSKGYDKAIDTMASLNEHDLVVAYGEIGLETGSTKELKVLRTQIELSKEYDIPAIVHTPRNNKLQITKKTLHLINKLRVNPKLIVIDHVMAETISLVAESGYNIGLTVQYGKLTPEAATNLILEYTDDNIIVLNSDSGFRKSDVTSVAKTINLLKSLDIEKNLLDKISHKNAEKIFYKM